MAILRSTPGMARAERSGAGRSAAHAARAADSTKDAPKKKVTPGAAWREARELLWVHRTRLIYGLLLMLASRLAGLVLPFSSKYVVDEVLGKGRQDLLLPIAAAAGLATAVQAVTSFANSQILGVAAQRAITDMRKRVQAKIMRLPVRYFDSTQTGVLISRIMSDAEGIRNLVGTGLVQLVGGFVTALLGLSVLFYINWRLTIVTIVILALFGGGMAARATRSVMNFLWTTFTRFEPAADIHAAERRIVRNHIVRQGPILIDARMKPTYPKELTCREDIAARVTARWTEYFPSRKVEMGDAERGHLD